MVTSQCGSVAMENHLRAAVVDSLNLYLFENAKFLCERLFASRACEEHALLLATCYFRCNQGYRAYYVLQGCISAQSRYLLALCCIQLAKYHEAEQALQLREGEVEVPNGAAGYWLLGKVCRLSNRHETAAKYFMAALERDPMMWCAFEELCQLGHTKAAETQLNSATCFSTSAADAGTPTTMDATPTSSAAPTSTPNANLSFAPTAKPLLHLSPIATPSSGSTMAGSSANTPPSASTLSVAPISRSAAPAMPRFAARPFNQDLYTPTPTPTWNMPAKFDSSAQSRHVQPFVLPNGHTPPSDDRSMDTDKDMTMPTASGPSLLGSNRDTLAMTPSSFRCSCSCNRLPCGEKTPAGFMEVLALLQQLGAGVRLLCECNCIRAVEAFLSLPAQQRKTGWVMSAIGRAYYEIVDYPRSLQYFQQARECDGYRVEDMEVYSTVLWHLKREVELSHLAQDVLALDRLMPQTWCVMGNCFSLQKEHETALRYFQRALQIDPFFTYAYTLCGHEYFANEDFDKSLSCYRNAIYRDPRHYNAWYGIGQIYFRQEKYEMAIQNFEKALEINSNSSVLHCYLGMAKHKQGHHNVALRYLNHAVEADPKNPLAKFEKANVLIYVDRLEEALQELQALKEIVPKEAAVYFQTGKIYKRLAVGQPVDKQKQHLGKALTHFYQALDLKPSSTDANLIKSAIEKIHLPEDDDEEEI